MSCASCSPSAPWWTGVYAGAHLPACAELHGLRGLTEDEHRMMQHVSMWGSDGYGAYYHRVKGGWIRTGPGAPPVVFKTKREMLSSLETFLGVLRDAIAGRI